MPIIQHISRLFRRSSSPVRVLPTTGFRIITGSGKLEEENWDWYTPDLFYPVRIGEVFQSQRYQVLGKLGYGTSSTAWLCRDLTHHKYVALKVCVRDYPSVDREAAAYDHLRTVKSRNPGRLLVRQALDAFKITGSKGEHQCFVHEPLGMSMETFRHIFPHRKVPENLMRIFVKCALQALDFLHTDAKMIHGDLQSMNFQLRLEHDDFVLKDFELSEMCEPTARKVYDDRVIYESREPKRPKNIGPPILCDFGEARLGHDTYTGDIQPELFRAPEIILQIPWTYSVDIWNLGVMVWDFFETKSLFNAENEEGESSYLHHLAEMIAVLGSPPPLEFLRLGGTSWDYFDATTGHWKGDTTIIPNLSLESAEMRLEGENKKLFLRFMRKMLQWQPEERATAAQLLDDPWINSKS